MLLKNEFYLNVLPQPKIPQMPKNLSAQFVCPSPKVLDFNEKRLHWASIVRASKPQHELWFFSTQAQLETLILTIIIRQSKICGNIEQQNIFFHSLMEN